MAYHCPRDLDGFLPHLQKSENRFRQQLGADLIAYLVEPSNPIVCQDIGQLVDGLIPWMQSSNHKVSSSGIEVMTCLIDRLGTDFRPYIQTVLPNVIDRLGDAKDTVREKSQLLILKLLERNVLTPQTLLDKLSSGFNHKNAKIREEVLRCLINTLNEHGAQSLTISKLIPDIVKLLSDPTSIVRDTAFNTLVDIYKHTGEKLRVDLQRRNLVPQSKWPLLSSRFDEARDNGELLCSAKCPDDVVDRIAMPKPLVSAKKPNLGAALKQRTLTPCSTTPASAGSVDEDFFLKSFEDVPNMQIFYPKEVTEHLRSVQDTISDPNKDWNKRVEALKKIRSLVIASALEFEEFFIGLKALEIPLQATLKDLRSQVVREACITIAYLAKNLANKFDKTAELLLQPLIFLIQNSAKVMASAGAVTVRFIIMNTHSARLIPIVTSNAVTSKSKEIRRACCEFLELMLSLWPMHFLERHVAALQEAVKKGIADADPDARVISRRSYRAFKDHFPDQAEALLQSLEPSYRRTLQGDGMSASSSNSNLASGFKTPRVYARSSGTPQSTSEGEVAQQARPRKVVDVMVTASPERLSRAKNRNSQSQPTSRSGSPSSRITYLYRNADHESPRPRRMSSGIPRSTQGSRDTSRETSPSRNINMNRFRSRGSERPPLSPASRPVLAQKILQQSREAENALADAFNDSASSETYRMPRKTMRSIDNHSDESETSSVCSERSYDSFKRTSDNIIEIITLCASTNWQERKDGLLSLQHYLTNEMRLTLGELTHLTEIFTRMFMDAHTKGLSVFLDTLHEVIKIHKNELHSWVYVLLQRVFLKLGSESLHSVQSKLMTTLDIIKVHFPITLLMTNVYRFLSDATQTPNSKVKSIVLNYLTTLCNGADASMFVADPGALQKIIAYSQDPKSSDIRIAAKVCVVAMWNCNTPAVTMMLTELPKELQEVAANIMHNHMRKSSTGSEPGSPLVTGSPKPLSPGTPPLRDGFDQEEIYRSLRKTTAEIQNYSYETLGSKLDRDRDTTSQDSGISQMSIGNDVKNDVAILEERLEDLSLKQPLFTKSGHRSLPYVNGMSEIDSSSNGYRSLGDIKHPDVLQNVFEYCLVDVPTPQQEKIRLFLQLIDTIKQGHTEHLLQKQNFMKLLRILIDHLNEKDSDIHVVVLQILTAIFECDDLKECCMSFLELLTLRVSAAFCDTRRDVLKEADLTAGAMAALPFTNIVNILAPQIQTNPYPNLLGAIKILTKLVEAHPKDVTSEHLKQIMPGLIKGTDHCESAVRKSSIFCMVAIHRSVGEAMMDCYMKQLTGSKVKLLKLYISRAQQQQTSLPTSPKNSSTS